MLSLGAILRNATLTFAIAAIAGLASVVLPAPAAADQARTAPHDTMTPFASDRALKRYLKRARPTPKPVPKSSMPVPMPVPAPPPAPPAPATDAAAADGAGESITNTQEAGVDEGGIVKNYRDMLVILRRGRLFTVSVRDRDLKPRGMIDAYPPGTNPNGAWYDEMLVAANRVIVIGYSYARGGTEISRFLIDPDGGLHFEDAYHLRSNDYYSSRNYASRLIGTKLIVYSPLYLPYGPISDFDWMPGLRRWTGDERAAFQRLTAARRIYVPENMRNPYEATIEALHTVTSCDLAARILRCDATAILGRSGRSFYVSPHAVYVWVGNHVRHREESGRSPSAMVYRLPLDGSAPSAIGVRGNPTDQFSFREDWNDGVLNVLVRSGGSGDAMWNPEFSYGTVSLLRLPLWAFGDGDEDARQSYYRMLPSPERDSAMFQNRFVGDYVLYGTGNTWGRPNDAKSALVAAPVQGGTPAEFTLEHGVDRIEALGQNAVVIGADSSDLHFQAVELSGVRTPVLGDRYTLERAAQGETRSHGFFFKPYDAVTMQDGVLFPAYRTNSAADDGVLALPVVRASRPGASQLVEGSAAITFLRRADRRFTPLGELFADDKNVVDDACKASCVDWYGNARPIFLRGRTFALMGYEIVEGKFENERIREIGRTNFAPRGR